MVHQTKVTWKKTVTVSETVFHAERGEVIFEHGRSCDL